MDARIYLTLGFTFIVGCFSGAYLYVTVFAPQYTDDGFDDPTEITFKLQGQTYGGCSRGDLCRYFVLNNNRSYDYQIGIREASEEVSGKMNRDDFNDLIDLLLETDFAAVQTIQNGSCASEIDQIDYSYNVILEGEVYPLDTCGTAFKNTALELTLRDLWEDLSVEQERDLPNILQGSASGGMEQVIDNWFQYDEKREARGER